MSGDRIVITLRRYLALADCKVTDSFGRKIRIEKDRGAFLDPAGAAPLVGEGILVEVVDPAPPPGGYTVWPVGYRR